MDNEICKNYLWNIVKEYYNNCREKRQYSLELNSIELDILKEYINNHEKIVITFNSDTGELIGNSTVFDSLLTKHNLDENDFIKHIRKLYFSGYLNISFKMEYYRQQVVDAINYFCSELLSDERKLLYEEVIRLVVIDTLKESNIEGIDFNVLKVEIPSELKLDYSKTENIKSKFEIYIHDGIEANECTKMNGRLYLTMFGYQKVISDMTKEMVAFKDEMLSIHDKIEKSKDTVECLSGEVKSLNNKSKKLIDDFYKNIITIISILIAAIAIINTNINTLPKISSDNVLMNIMSIIAINCY